jgi:hypothetical protein
MIYRKLIYFVVGEFLFIALKVVVYNRSQKFRVKSQIRIRVKWKKGIGSALKGNEDSGFILTWRGSAALSKLLYILYLASSEPSLPTKAQG